MKKIIPLFGMLALAACQTDSRTASAGMTTGFPKCDAMLSTLQAQDNAATIAMKNKTPKNVTFVAKVSAYFRYMTTQVQTTCPAHVTKIVVPEVNARIPVLDKFVNS